MQKFLITCILTSLHDFHEIMKGPHFTEFVEFLEKSKLFHILELIGLHVHLRTII
jgi:hypothetical protein